MTTDTRANEYLSRLRASLSGMTIAEREDIVEEIRVHIVERASEPGADLDEVLAALGPAEALARQYRTGALLREASRSNSPWLILRATKRAALTGAKGFLLFWITLIGYGAALSFVALALLKPLFPAHTGLWVGRGEFDFAYRPGMPPAGVHEVLGMWFIPVVLVLAFGFAVGTTKLTQFLIRRFGWFRRVVIHMPAATGSLLTC